MNIHSEAIVVLEGEIRIRVFDKNRNIVNEIELVEKDSIVFHSGVMQLMLLKTQFLLNLNRDPTMNKKTRLYFSDKCI